MACPARIRDQLRFTHVHNGFFITLVDAGELCLALLAPVVAASRPSPERVVVPAVSLPLVTSCLATGSFGTTFGHRVVDTIHAYISAPAIAFSCWTTPSDIAVTGSTG